MKNFVLGVGACAAFAVANPSQADVVVSHEQVGNDVLISFQGFADVSNLTLTGNVGGGGSLVESINGIAVIWSNIVPGADRYAFGNPHQLDFYSENISGGNIQGTATGDPFAFRLTGSSVNIYFEDGFSSGDIGGTLTLENTSLGDLGVTHTRFEWGDGPGESITVLPEPSTGLLALASMLFLTCKRRVFNN